MNITYYEPPYQHCNGTLPFPTETYVLGKCYPNPIAGATMFKCTGSSVTFLAFEDRDCADIYPGVYGLPAFMCMSPVYDWSTDYDTVMICFNDM